MTIQQGNIFARLPDASKEEIFETLATMGGRTVLLERICSEGQASPPEFWYDQSWDEWVLVLRGGAELEIADPPRTVRLGEGDWFLLPSGVRHRVARTEPGTLWLAVHADGPAAAP